jgi:hypothetical protein
VWDGSRWLVGDNEVSDKLFAYDEDFRPIGTVPVVPPVEDIEALAVDGPRVIVVGSSGRKKGGEDAPNRRRVVEVGTGEVKVPWELCGGCGLELPPDGGGLNVEGAAWWKGALWLGLRSPVPEGKTTLFNATTGERLAQDWGGAGVRDLAVRDGQLLLILGPSTKEERAYLLASFEQGPLGLTLPPDAEGLGVGPKGELVVVTDGGWEKDQKTCKHPSLWQRLSY